MATGPSSLSEAELRARDATAALLTAREARSLRWSVAARLAFMASVVVVVLPVTGQPVERVALLAMITALGALQLFMLTQLRRERPNLERVGWLGAGTDVIVVVGLPILWNAVYGAPVEPLVHLTRHNYTPVCVIVMALSVGALRPALPAVVSAAVVATHVVVAFLSLGDSRLADYEGGISRAMGVGMSEIDLLFVTPLFLGIAGVLLTLATRAARSTLLEVVALQQAERDLRERQLEAVLDARMGALGELVAGLEHEVNSPLGAMRSANDTGTRAVARLHGALAATSGSPPEVQRALAALEQSLELSSQGGARVSEVMATIRGFVQLDAADLQQVDLAEVVRDVLALAKPALRADTTLEGELAEGLFVDGDPRRLAQAFATVVRNAAEAFDAPGELRVSLSREGDDAVIQIADQGRGMTAAQVAHLFEVDFAATTRVRARFGLAVCRSIVRRHGGEVRIDSQPGQGTTVTLQLPLARPR